MLSFWWLKVFKGVLVDESWKRQYLSPESRPVKEQPPYLFGVGVDPKKFTRCTRTHQDHYPYSMICGHLWNPTIERIFQTKDWLDANFQYVTLKTMHRQSNDQKYLEVLNKVKLGEIDSSVENYLDSLQRPLPKELLPVHVKLRTHNKNVDYINADELSKIKAKQEEFIARDSGVYYTSGEKPLLGTEKESYLEEISLEDKENKCQPRSDDKIEEEKEKEEKEWWFNEEEDEWQPGSDDEFGLIKVTGRHGTEESLHLDTIINSFELQSNGMSINPHTAK